MSKKYTRQGVLDLNSIAGKSSGRKLEMPPQNQFCKHDRRKEFPISGDSKCLDCDMLWDHYGHPY